MKVLLLSGGSSIHTIRWANALAAEGVEIVLVTQHEVTDPPISSVRVRKLPFSGGIGYFLNAVAVRRIVTEEAPDLINAHYASGYGTISRLSGFSPTLLSVWGSDVYDFPEKSPLHRWWVRSNLMAATRVASTSHVMAEQSRRIAPQLGTIAITPFGVDTSIFSPSPRSPQADRPIVIGTVKTLDAKYGIDTLIEAIAALRQMLVAEAPRLAARLRCRIVGGGPQKEQLKQQAKTLGVDDIIEFVGRVPHETIPEELRSFDIYAALSRLDSESFGVAIIEAESSGLPVVVSNVGGLPEVTVDGVTGFVVPKEDPEAAAKALYALVCDADVRRQMGQAGRQLVVARYEWRNNVRHMIDLYQQIIVDSKKAEHP